MSSLMPLGVLLLALCGCHTPQIRGVAQLDRNTAKLFLNLMHDAPLIVLGQAEELRESPYVHRTPDNRQYPVRGYNFRLRVFTVLKGALASPGQYEVVCYKFSSKVEAPRKGLNVEFDYPKSAIFFLALEGSQLRCYNDVYLYWLAYYGRLPPNPQDVTGATADAIAQLLLAFPREEKRVVRCLFHLLRL